MFEVFENRPDGRGRFGEFGGRYVPEILMPALLGAGRGVCAGQG